ncbi:40-residue YVTN family beta-propeller repeat-containing protein [Parasphingorhabdus marina DSM 22363]|uniref:40-residue YVTN family beta-propeller repeat-containing protein n=1 Tax=Parasphingorhabdus marina DSM 22363 TaxID=1123272 RepID=A0A1N6EQR9_9SPHN|nr:YncE family protein [Parasphingorhabdus marina]SIN85439.1 40-residue YVTN family beta-propeller repeat-containing protein [Parasphingorhabdus marina DSM 22363]
MRNTLIGIIAALVLTACTASAEGSGPAPSGKSGLLLVGNKGEDTLSFVDLETGEELSREPTGSQPHEIAISPDGRLAAVVSYGGESIDLFDTAARKKVETIMLSPNKRPHGIAWLNDGRIVATTEGSDTITVVSPPDGESRTRTITSVSTGQKGSHMLAVSPSRDRVYVSNMQSGTVSVIDFLKKRKIRDLAAGREPEGLALTPNGKRLLVADRQEDVLYIFDTESLTEIAALDTGKFPIRVAVSPDGRIAVTSNLGDGALGVYDLEKLEPLPAIEVSGDARAAQVTILFSDDGKTIYAAETGTNRIAEIDIETGMVVRRLPAGTKGDGLGIVPAAP